MLTSLQYLLMDGCPRVWSNCARKQSRKKVALINDLQSLRQLKKLHIDYSGEIIGEGTLGSMEQIETLHLKCKRMESLPDDIIKMSKLRRLLLGCPSVVKMEGKFSEFFRLTWVKFWECDRLEELPDLHKLINLRKLEIYSCFKLKKFPKKFGEKGAFPLLKIFSLVNLRELEELPIIEEGAMSSLTILTIVSCEALKMLPKEILNIKSLQKVRVWGCSIVLKIFKKVEKTNTIVEVLTMTNTEVMKISEKFKQVENMKNDYFYSEFWCNEFSLFLGEMKTLYLM